MNIFFDVDYTIIDNRNGLRPGVRELFAQLVEAGHAIFLWSGIGPRWEVVERFGFEKLISGCFEKPLSSHEEMLELMGISPRPDFVVDDHPHLVDTFGGCVVAQYLLANAADREMERVWREIVRAIASRIDPVK
jgi:hypothetical protein